MTLKMINQHIKLNKSVFYTGKQNMTTSSRSLDSSEYDCQEVHGGHMREMVTRWHRKSQNYIKLYCLILLAVRYSIMLIWYCQV